MYRTISPLIKSIYCNEKECNHRCGRFHKSSSAGRPRPKPPRKPSHSLDIPTTSALDIDTTTPNMHRLSVTTSHTNPTSPFSTSSTITLDDIIASARRKTSIDFQPIVLPSPVFLDELPSQNDEPYFRTDSKSSMEGINELEDEFVQHLIDSDSEDEFWNNEPTSLIVDDELADFEELLKATQQPQDHYSNPTDRPADPLKRKRKKMVKQNEDDSSSIELSVADIDPEVLSFYNQQFTAITTGNFKNVEYEGNL
uniref:Uncharacterized protein n=1 Tax=Panagrolaimus sp. PS1159 TaxID=55785 RepID=A0AC35FCU6_9BILA